VFGFDPTSNAPSPLYHLATDAVVDPVNADGSTGAITRMQYNKAGSAFQFNRIYVEGTFQYTDTDFSSNLGQHLTVSAFFAPASLFAPGAVPSALEILTKGPALTVYRASQSLTSSADPNWPYVNFVLQGPWADQLQANAKYWLLVMPTAVANMGTSPSYANDLPIAGTLTGRDLARGISLWTNRTPGKPTITSPVAGTIFNSGDTSTFSFTPADPDSIVGAPTYHAPGYADVAGVQVQYAAQPTVGGPTQVWVDAPIMATSGGVSGNGWYIDQSTRNGTNPGAMTLWRDFTLAMAVGSLAPAAGAMALPSGDWQIRMRTFDYGHPYPQSGEAPLFASDLATLVPSSYPAVNTSPWSDPINISVTAQVPPPTLISPINDSAIVQGTPVSLTWQYRNTYTPPYAQATRQIQMRKLGQTTWTTVVTGASSAASWIVTGYALTATTCYEWRVQVTDTTTATSNWSQIGRFWVVSPPGSGAVLGIPTSTVDGAALGCGTHRVEVYRRGGIRRVGEIRSLSHVDWERVRDDPSTSKVEVSGWDDDCGNLLAQLQTWAYEIVIYRATAFGTKRVWEGPITQLTYEADKVTINATDVMGYGKRRIIKQTMTDAGGSVVNRAVKIIQTFFAPDDPNLLPHLQVLSRNDDSGCYRSVAAWSKSVFEEIDDMAANAGLDYTVIGRSLMLWGTKHRIGTLPEFRDKDLGAIPIVSEYGMSAANVYSVTDGNGIHGESYRGGVTPDNSVIDPVYGLVEMLGSTWSSSATTNTGTYTQALQDSFSQQAESAIADRYTPPVIVRLPANTTLNPDAVIDIQQLVPGVVIPLRSTGTLRKVMCEQKLDSIKVVEEKGVETISITMSPFNSDSATIATEGV
jgi:hypothetical protein